VVPAAPRPARPRPPALRGRYRRCGWVAALRATRLSRGLLASPFTAREVYRQEWTGLTEPQVVPGALE